ncbi:vesicular-fusion protein Sec18p [Diutina catenulata]
MEKFGFHKVTNNPVQGGAHISHSRPDPPNDNRSMISPISRPMSFMVDKVPSNDIAVANRVAVNEEDFAQYPDHMPLLLDGHYVYEIEKSPLVPRGSVGLAGHSRKWGKWSLRDKIQAQPYNIHESGSQKKYINSISMSIDFFSQSGAHSNPIKVDEITATFMNNYESQILQPTQPMVIDFQGKLFKVCVQTVEIVDVSQADGLPDIKQSADLDTKGIITKSTSIDFFAHEGSSINLMYGSGKGGFFSRPKPRGPRKQLINPDFKLEDLGIGGLDDEFQEIFRRAFNSRILPPELAEKLEYKHCKGMLLYGPPGTGKTLIARKLSKMLNGREPKIVNGPEMLSKFVGESEENIRKLFKEAEAEYKSKGDESDLHVIIFDELDSVFKQRGSGKSDGTGVGDNVVNQLLSKMDGVDQLNNILIIGMTNRLDLIDKALLRPGRFELQIEIALPDEKGRHDILLIHTKSLRENGLLDNDVDFHELAVQTKNFTGAELEGLCNSAKSFAISRHTKSGTIAQIDMDSISRLKITREDFILALGEVKPAFGTDEEDLEAAAPHGIIQYSSAVKQIFDKGQSFIEEVKHSETDSLISVLLHGPPGSGKTAIAATLALNSDFPFIKMLSAESVVGMSEQSKIAYIDNFFRDVYKSPLSVLVIDKLETLISYVPIGPRFSNDILQVIKVYLTKKPPKGRRLLILATTSAYGVLKNMDLLGSFSNALAIPAISDVQQLGRVLSRVGYEREKNNIVGQLEGYNVNIGVKKLLQVLMNCRYSRSDSNAVVESIIEANEL